MKEIYYFFYYDSFKSQRIFGAGSAPRGCALTAGQPARGRHVAAPPPPAPAASRTWRRRGATSQHAPLPGPCPRLSPRGAAPSVAAQPHSLPTALLRRTSPCAPARPATGPPAGLLPPAPRHRPRRRRHRPLAGPGPGGDSRQRPHGGRETWQRRGTRFWEPGAGLWPPSAKVRAAGPASRRERLAEPRHKACGFRRALFPAAQPGGWRGRGVRRGGPGLSTAAAGGALTAGRGRRGAGARRDWDRALGRLPAPGRPWKGALSRGSRRHSAWGWRAAGARLNAELWQPGAPLLCRGAPEASGVGYHVSWGAEARWSVCPRGPARSPSAARVAPATVEKVPVVSNARFVLKCLSVLLNLISIACETVGATAMLSCVCTYRADLTGYR